MERERGIHIYLYIYIYILYTPILFVLHCRHAGSGVLRSGTRFIVYYLLSVVLLCLLFSSDPALVAGVGYTIPSTTNASGIG